MIESISFKFGCGVNGQALSLKPGHMTVFVGPNNSGKTIALREIRSAFLLIHAGLRKTNLSTYRQSGALSWTTSVRQPMVSQCFRSSLVTPRDRLKTQRSTTGAGTFFTVSSMVLPFLCRRSRRFSGAASTQHNSNA